MYYPRLLHGITVLGNKIYVAGGLCRGNVVRKCERFDLQKKIWAVLPYADFDEFGNGVTLMATKSRYVIAVGGKNSAGNCA